MDMTRRGIVRVPRELLEDAPDAVHEALQPLLVLRAECDMFTGFMMYHGVCELFGGVPKGGEAPHYDVEVVTEELEDGSVNIVAVHIND